MASLLRRRANENKASRLSAMLSGGQAVALQGVLLSVLLNAAGQLFFKAAHAAHPGSTVLTQFFFYQTWIGIGLYGASALCWLWVLARAHLSFAYPILALTFPIVVGLSALLFGEVVPLVRWVGVGVIVIGVSLLART